MASATFVLPTRLAEVGFSGLCCLLAGRLCCERGVGVSVALRRGPSSLSVAVAARWLGCNGWWVLWFEMDQGALPLVSIGTQMDQRVY